MSKCCDKMYVVVVFLFVWVLFQVVSVEARCSVEYPDPRTLYILNTSNYYDRNIDYLIEELDSRFFNIPIEPLQEKRDGSNLYEITHYKVLQNCSPYLMDVMKDAHNLRYMIHLQVKDFYKNNYNAVSKLGYTWAGDVRCKKSVTNYWKMFCSSNKKVKLVSEAVSSIQSLYNLTLNLPKKDHLTHFIILVCSKNDKDLSPYTTFSYFDATSIKITYKLDNCNKKIWLGDKIIAIIAPNPNYVQVTHKPVVFYDETYVLPRAVELYDNSVMRVTSWKTLARAMLELMKRKHWSRIAVLSDDSEASNGLEQELRTLFSNNDISYVVVAAKITKQGYDFSEALASLKHYDARIIVANVDEQQVGTLGRQAAEHELTSSHKHLWLVPGWSNDAINAAFKMGTVLNFLPRKTDLDDILLRITRLIQSKRFEGHYDYLNSKVFARDIANYLHTNDCIDVFQTKSRDRIDNVASIVNKVITRASFYAPRDRQDDCLIKSQNYYKPCDDMVVMYFMLVIMVFTVTILGITYFFQTSLTPYKRM